MSRTPGPAGNCKIRPPGAHFGWTPGPTRKMTKSGLVGPTLAGPQGQAGKWPKSGLLGLMLAIASFPGAFRSLPGPPEASRGLPGLPGGLRGSPGVSGGLPGPHRVSRGLPEREHKISYLKKPYKTRIKMQLSHFLHSGPRGETQKLLEMPYICNIEVKVRFCSTRALGGSTKFRALKNLIKPGSKCNFPIFCSPGLPGKRKKCLKCRIFVISGSTFTPPDHARKKHRENTFEMGPRPELQSAASPFFQHPSGENAFVSTRALGKSTKLRVQKNPIKHGSKCSCSIFCNTSRVKMRFWEHSEFPGREPKLE